MREAGADSLLVTTLDDIAWLFNLRGSDIQCNPVFLAYALVSPTKVQLFTDEARIEPDALRRLQTSSVEVQPYNLVAEALANLAPNSQLMLDPDTTNQWLVQALPTQVDTIETASPTRLLKAIKNTTEIEKMGGCHRRGRGRDRSPNALVRRKHSQWHSHRSQPRRETASPKIRSPGVQGTQLFQPSLATVPTVP